MTLHVAHAAIAEKARRIGALGPSRIKTDE